ncbi:hypothetical protein V5799_017353 [Amblyomma americanum]|uniref:Uncharacterized protein n=1 Tax=Amblyomma americanum TaxID=6943 RepID=A0AAQ4F3G9_AMBAM
MTRRCCPRRYATGFRRLAMGFHTKKQSSPRPKASPTYLQGTPSNPISYIVPPFSIRPSYASGDLRFLQRPQWKLCLFIVDCEACCRYYIAYIAVLLQYL